MLSDMWASLSPPLLLYGSNKDTWKTEWIWYEISNDRQYACVFTGSLMQKGSIYLCDNFLLDLIVHKFLTFNKIKSPL